MQPLPEIFCERLRSDLGADEAKALCAALDTPSPTAVRLHPRKGAHLEWGEPIPWSAWGRYLAERPSFTLDVAFHAGAYYVQEASSQFVGYLLRGEEMRGKRLLDLCAAPGGKTTLYASLVGNEGLVVANEVDRRRVQILADNIRKWGMGNVVVATNEAADYESLPGYFDVVAVDAPCSGEGMFRRLPESREEWTPQAVGQCAAIQREILRSAWQSLKPGGVLLYSTCTFNRTEDEEVLADFAAWAGEELQTVPLCSEVEAWGIVTGEVGAFKSYRFYPHRAKGEGFFVAIARKSESAEEGAKVRKMRRQKSPIQPAERVEVQELERWVENPASMAFYRAGELLYGCRKEHLEPITYLSGLLRVVSAGVAMGEIFKRKLKPDWPLALYVGLNREALPVAELPEEAACDFLRKGDLRAEWFDEGINLVCCRGLALGFVKRIGARVNNLYPNSLRILNK